VSRWGRSVGGRSHLHSAVDFGSRRPQQRSHGYRAVEARRYAAVAPNHGRQDGHIGRPVCLCAVRTQAPPLGVSEALRTGALRRTDRGSRRGDARAETAHLIKGGQRRWQGMRTVTFVQRNGHSRRRASRAPQQAESQQAFANISVLHCISVAVALSQVELAQAWPCGGSAAAANSSSRRAPQRGGRARAL